MESDEESDDDSEYSEASEDDSDDSEGIFFTEIVCQVSYPKGTICFCVRTRKRRGIGKRLVRFGA